MINVQNILYATDFSPQSNQAYFHAVGLAEHFNASLTIVFVYSPSVTVPVGAEVGMPPTAVADQDDREYWRGQLEQIRPVNPAIRIRHVLLTGNPAEEIIRYATENRTDLIVMGTHGRTGLERLLMGSVAEKVLRGALCSVLVVKMPKPIAAVEPAGADAAQAYA
jgi:nucleotide-binding universal stress UspA family protein